MICRFYKEGIRLDVAGLNEITVLIDRSETELSQAGVCCFHPKDEQCVGEAGPEGLACLSLNTILFAKNLNCDTNLDQSEPAARLLPRN